MTWNEISPHMDVQSISTRFLFLNLPGGSCREKMLKNSACKHLVVKHKLRSDRHKIVLHLKHTLSLGMRRLLVVELLLWSTDRQARPLQLPVHWRTKHTTSISSITDRTPNKEALSSLAFSNPPKKWFDSSA